MKINREKQSMTSAAAPGVMLGLIIALGLFLFSGGRLSMPQDGMAQFLILQFGLLGLGITAYTLGALPALLMAARK